MAELSNPWYEFEAYRSGIRLNTVDKLKQILSGLNEECGTRFSKTGKKQDIIDRIVSTLDAWRATNMQDKFTRAKNVLTQVRQFGIYSPSRGISSGMQANRVAPPTASSGSNSSLNPARPDYIGSASSNHQFHNNPNWSGSSSTSRPQNIRFKPSPFFAIEQSITPVFECPESTSATDRRTQSIKFSLTSDQIAKLKLPTYQIRLFCTSSVFWTPNPSAFRTNAGPCPIEFPATCEVRVNGVQLTANLKGLKKKPGTAPPPDITKVIRLNLQGSFNVDMVYVNSQQPVQPKKFYLVVMLVNATSVDQLVDKLKKGKYRSSEEIKQSRAAQASDDDDIVASGQKMSLKCPLSFMRVSTPCRSAHCVHPSCFDATSWFSMMEQTTTWLCPICEKVLSTDDLIIDGYFDDILNQCPDSVEDVIVEPDGEWHTSDNKYASIAWSAHHPAAAPLPPSPSRPPLPPKPSPSKTSAAPLGSKTVPNEILVLDSDDDEDEGQVKRELSPSFASSSSVSVAQSGSAAPSVPSSQADDIIDLTLDSDDEVSPSQPPDVGRKRTADDAGLDAGLVPTSPTEPIWKKGRVELPLPRSVLHPGSSNNINTTAYIHNLPQVSTGSQASPPPTHHPTHFSGNRLPPVYPPRQYAPRGSHSGNEQYFHPSDSGSYSRLNHSSHRWP